MLRLNKLLLLILSLLLCSCVHQMQTIGGSSTQNLSKSPSAAADTAIEGDQAIEEKQLTVAKKTSSNLLNWKGKNHEQETMDEALELLGQSQESWEKGELENALKSLDKAYELILDVDGDPDISRQKDDLRFMISKRILEIYASRYTVATGNQSEIPLIMNEDIKKEIRLFQTSERRFFVGSYQRSGLYRPIILEHLKKAGLPEELSWLPLVESGFKIKALSRARALGLWQFIPSTGYKFGLKRDNFVDERMDVVKSTEAAIAYLKELHGMFGDWMTVLAAYNCGEGRVLKVISRQHVNYLDNFWDLYRRLPCETARYVPRFLATLHIIKDPDKYGIDLSNNLEEPITYELVKTNKCMSLQDIALHLNISEKALTSLNSELRHKLTPDREYDLKIPPGAVEQFTLVANKIPKRRAPCPAFVRHRVRRGESLSVIAERYKSSVRAIVAYNHLKSRHRIREGQRLKIPIRGYGYTQPTTKKRVRISRVSKTLLPGKVIEYRVKRGDSLWLLARRFNTTISEIKGINNLRGSRLRVGQTIKIKSSTATNTYTVRKGDCLDRIARKHKVSLRSLLRMNKLSRRDRIYPGQIIIVER
ncbi:MAG: LysM peptidoglycan-binding domain-containing protein [Thermodesulfobacteriota bacterium]|nr:LysM peptidoglycan-binding domain-containing protein [Thermodesulfobacteriota bacterium]